MKYLYFTEDGGKIFEIDPSIVRQALLHPDHIDLIISESKLAL